MDFLLLFSDAGRVVIEVDGSQHFAEDGKPSLARYSDMVAADRDLRLAGYEVHRFGANELTGQGSAERIEEFFRRLLRKHGVLSGATLAQ
jgi:very-short-patch-repair endonuclease